MIVSQPLQGASVSPPSERFPQTMKKIGLIALLLALILYVVNRVRNDTVSIMETDVDA